MTIKESKQDKLPNGIFTAPNSLPSGQYRKDKDKNNDNDDFNYFYTVLFAMIFTVPSYGLVKGFLIACIWPVALLISMLV